jgi:hypothetical protein
MTISSRARFFIGAGVVVALLFYLVVVDLGVNAGRIHYGVTVEGVEVGGLTGSEAMPVLDKAGERLKHSTIQFSASGVTCEVRPAEIGWGPQPFDTAKSALQVGRAHAPFGALIDRVRAWVAGVRVSWADAPNPGKLDRFLRACDAQAKAAGVTVDDARLRAEVGRAIVTWPRRVFPLPLAIVQ